MTELIFENNELKRQTKCGKAFLGNLEAVGNPEEYQLVTCGTIGLSADELREIALQLDKLNAAGNKAEKKIAAQMPDDEEHSLADSHRERRHGEAWIERIEDLRKGDLVYVRTRPVSDELPRVMEGIVDHVFDDSVSIYNNLEYSERKITGAYGGASNLHNLEFKLWTWYLLEAVK